MNNLQSLIESPEFQEELCGADVEALAFSDEQVNIMLDIDEAARMVLLGYGICDLKSPNNIVLYRYSNVSVPDSEWSAYHPDSGNIYICDNDLERDGGVDSINRFWHIYSHELGHSKAVVHKISDPNENEKEFSDTGIFIDYGSPYRGLFWMNEVLTAYLSEEFIREAGCGQIDIEMPDTYRDCFSSLCLNLAKYLDSNSEWLTRFSYTLSFLAQPEIIDATFVKRLLISGYLNSQAHDEVVSLIKEAYSKKMIHDSRNYKNMWDKFCDDIGLLGIDCEPEDFEL